MDLIHPKPKFNPKVEQAFLESLPKNEAREVAGSWEKRRRILVDEETLETIYNEGKDPLYRWKRVGDLAQTTAMPQVHPDVLRSGDAAQIQAAEALVKAITMPEWGTKKFQAGKMTQRTLDQFDPYRHIPEVKQLISDIQNKSPVDGLMLHYLKRRYVENEMISKPDDLNIWFSNVLQDKEAVIFKRKPGGRYVVHSKKWALLAVFESTGKRVSVYDYPLNYQGDPWCLIQQLII